MKDSEKLKSWVYSLSVKEYPEKRDRLINECQITYQVFSFWKSGRTKIPPLAKPIIERIAGKKIFWEGE